MKEKDQTEKTELKAYPEWEDASIYAVNEPEVLYGTKANVAFTEEFNRALATAINPGRVHATHV